MSAPGSQPLVAGIPVWRRPLRAGWRTTPRKRRTKTPRSRCDNACSTVGSLPSLPTVLGRLLKLIKDPESTMSDLEVLLNSEPSITLKILQVANSAAVAGAASQGATSLKDAITRLDNRKVGAIAQ
jgi:HD-like signal output (HDOD) protein